MWGAARRSSEIFSTATPVAVARCFREGQCPVAAAFCRCWERAASSEEEAGPCSAGTRANAYYQGPVSDHFDGVRFFNPDRRGPKGRLAFLRWQLFDRGGPWPSRVPEPIRRRPAARTVHRRRGAHDPCRARQLPDPDAAATTCSSIRSGRNASPFSFAGPKRVNRARHRLRRPAADRCGARHPQSLRPHGHRHHRAAVAALPAAHRHAARQRHDPEGRGAGTRRRRGRLGCGG